MAIVKLFQSTPISGIIGDGEASGSARMDAYSIYVGLAIGVSDEDMASGLVKTAIGYDLYSHVSDVDATSLNDAFTISNIGPEHNITRHIPMHSGMVGDIFMDDEGSWLCNNVGWVGLGQTITDALLNISRT